MGWGELGEEVGTGLDLEYINKRAGVVGVVVVVVVINVDTVVLAVVIVNVVVDTVVEVKVDSDVSVANGMLTIASVTGSAFCT